MSEIWRDIQGYEGLYQVSSEGRVKSLKYGKERILKPRADRYGYMYVILCMDGQRKYHLVHRLVANEFLDNPDGLPQVNHKDECKTNNTVENLEWCTHEYNNNYGTHNQRVAEANINGKLSIPVDMLTKEGELIRTFPSSHEAERWLRINGFPKAVQAAIIQCCKGNPKYTHAYGFKWRYTNSKSESNSAY